MLVLDTVEGAKKLLLGGVGEAPLEHSHQPNQIVYSAKTKTKNGYKPPKTTLKLLLN
jgi:hypothetical protein